MTCPRCGGTQRVQLAPTLFECRSQTTTRVPTGAPPGGPNAMRPLYGTCGHRYQEGSAAANTGICSCGVYAVAVCQGCAAPVCGKHLDDVDGKAYCGPCAHRAGEAAVAEQRAARQAELDAERALKVEASVAELAAAVRNPRDPRYQHGFRNWTPLTGAQMVAILGGRAQEELQLRSPVGARTRGFGARKRVVEYYRGWVLPKDGHDDSGWNPVQSTRYLTADGQLWEETTDGGRFPTLTRAPSSTTMAMTDVRDLLRRAGVYPL